MHAAPSPLAVIEGNITLNQPRVQPASLKFSLAPRPRKKTTAILLPLRIDYVGAFEVCLRENQDLTAPTTQAEAIPWSTLACRQSAPTPGAASAPRPSCPSIPGTPLRSSPS